jgi:NAD dependent epimerase/dehydratase family enzyme
MKLLLGEAAEELLLGSKKMSADKLLATGFEFSHPDLESASNYVAGKTS